MQKYGWLRTTAIAIAMVLTVATVSSCDQKKEPKQAAQLQSVKVLLDWRAEPTYAGFYLAKARGYYKKRGLDVELIQGNGATTSAQLIAAGKDYEIGSDSGEATAIAVSRGLPIKSVAVLYPDTPTVIYSRTDTPIRKPSDLIGKRIGLISGSITTDEFRGILNANHIDPSKITEVGAGFDVAPLLTHKVDGLLNYAELTPVQLRLQGHDVVTMRLSDYGVKAYSLNIIANDKLLKDDPKLVSKIIAATEEGYQFVRDHPAEAAKQFASIFPEKSPTYVNASMKIVAQQLGAPVGGQTRSGWQATINTLDSLGLLQRKIAVDDVAANGYLGSP